MAIRQISVFVGNEKGALCALTGALAEAGVNLRALSVADTQDFGILRLIVDDPDRAKAVLEANGKIVSVTNVVAVSIPDEPGGLARVLSILRDADINLEYLYAFVAPSGGHASLVLRVADNAAAEAVLAQNGIPLE